MSGIFLFVNGVIGSLPAPILAGTGGSISTTTTGLYPGKSWVHVFSGPGTFAVPSPRSVSFLSVGGGGGAGAPPPSGSGGQAGGGGAGGMVTGTFLAVSGVNYAITVGSGGAGSVYSAGPGLLSISNAGNPSAIIGTGISITALGGGRAVRPCAGSGGPGGSGGGGTGAPSGSTPFFVGGSATQPAQAQTVGAGGTYTNYGNAGGTAVAGGGGGGGGAGIIGGNAVSYSRGGNGGDGIAFSIVGTSTYYAGGGGGVINSASPGFGTGGLGGGGKGGTSTVFSPLQNGVCGTGGGGGAGYSTPTKNGGSGGSGIVIISYQG
jgi:hypothetical protein